jgi:large subunit ribosomal protein L10
MRAEKKYLISEVETHLKKSDYVILANFTKVTVADVAELRAKLAVEKAEFHVVKNSSLRVAAKALGLPEFEGALTGPTAIVVGGKNSAGVAKVLKQFFKDKQKLEVKIGVLDKKVFSAADLAKIADLPPFDVLRSQFLSLLTSNAAAFVRVLDAKVKKESPAAPAA